MRAVILATGYQKNLYPLILHRPTPMLKIGDRPLIDLLIEYLAHQKIDEFHLILSHHPHMVENYLAEGKHWGVKIFYYLVREPSVPFKTLQPSLLDSDPLLIGNVETLPLFNLAHTAINQKPMLFYSPSTRWTGWGVFQREHINSIFSTATLTDWLNFPLHNPHHIEKCKILYSISDFKDLQEANFQIFSQQEESFHFPATARKSEPGIWISHGATIHQKAELKPPVFIGEYTQVNQGAKIGPNVVIEKKCFIDNESTIQNTLICENSYIGQGLVINNCIVDRNLLINLSYETHVTIGENFILCELKPPFFSSVSQACGKVAAFFLVIFFSPIMGIASLFRKVHRRSCVLLPASYDSHIWKTFSLLSFTKKGESHPPVIPQGFINCLPMLWNIVRGELHFTGVRPRTIEEVAKLPKDWQHLYLRSQLGLITLASVELPENASEEEVYTSEAYYVVHFGFLERLTLCLRWLGSMFGTKTKKT